MTIRLAFFVFILLLALSPTLAWCQSVSNVRAGQTEDDQIIVTYDLLGESYQTFEISLLLSRDGGQNFDITPRTVSGDVGKDVKPGRGIKMVWDVLMDVPRLQGSAFVFRVTAVGKQGAQYDRAIASFKEVAKADPLGFDHTRRLADAYAKSKQDSLAALTYEAALKLDATKPDVYGEAGAVYMRLRKWERAADMFEKRYKLDPNATTAYLNYANCNIQLGRIDNARVAFRQAVAQRPQYIPARLSLARCLSQARYKTDSLQTARTEFETVIKLADTSVVKYKNELFDAYTGLAYTYYVEKKYSQTVEALDKALKFKPDDPPAHKFKAQILFLMNRLDEAKQEYQKYLKLNPKDKDATRELEQVVARLKSQ